MMIIEARVDSGILHLPLAYTLALPDDAKARHGCPVLLVLHDLGQYQQQAREMVNMDALADRLGVALVMPEGRRSCFVDMAHGPRWNAALADELLPNLHRVFGLQADGAGVVGLGAGAIGAVQLARHKAVVCCGMMNPRLSDAFAPNKADWPIEAEWTGVFGSGWQEATLRDACGLVAPNDQTEACSFRYLDKTRWESCTSQDASDANKLEALLCAAATRLK